MCCFETHLKAVRIGVEDNCGFMMGGKGRVGFMLFVR